MKICDLTNFFSPKSGGVKTYITYKQDYIAKNAPQHSHMLIVPGETSKTITNGCCEIIYVEGPQIPWDKNYRAIRNLSKIAEIIAEKRPDIIEIGSPYLMPWAVRRVARTLNIPLVGFFHSNFPETYVKPGMAKYGKFAKNFVVWMAWMYAKIVYSFCDVVVATSEHAKQCLNEANINHTVKIPFGVDTDNFSPSKKSDRIRKQFNIPQNRSILLYVGRLSKEKDLDSLFSAFSILEAETPDEFSLMIVGCGPSTDEIIEKTNHYKNIIYAGYHYASDGLPEYYASADIFVTPSPNETFGLSPLEAISSGLPVVAVKGGAVSELLPSEGHELAEPFSPVSLAQSIRKMKTKIHPDLSRSIRNFSIDRFSWNSTFTKLFELYEQLSNDKQK